MKKTELEKAVDQAKQVSERELIELLDLDKEVLLNYLETLKGAQNDIQKELERRKK